MMTEMELMRFIWYVELISGLLANFGTIAYMVHHLSQPKAPQKAIAQTLLAMAYCYTVLLAFTMFGHIPPSTWRTDVTCKLSVFFIHAASMASIGFWMVLSFIRFIAIYYPFWYKHVRRKVPLILGGVVVASGVIESWTLVTVGVRTFDGKKRSSCGDTQASYSESEIWINIQTGVHIAELTVSYALPVIAILVLDSLVICFANGPPPQEGTPSCSMPSNPGNSSSYSRRRPSTSNPNHTAPVQRYPSADNSATLDQLRENNCHSSEHRIRKQQRRGSNSQGSGRNSGGTTETQTSARSKKNGGGPSRAISSIRIIKIYFLLASVHLVLQMPFYGMLTSNVLDLHKIDPRIQRYIYMLNYLQYIFIVPYMWVLIYKRKAAHSNRGINISTTAVHQKSSADTGSTAQPMRQLLSSRRFTNTSGGAKGKAIAMRISSCSNGTTCGSGSASTQIASHRLARGQSDDYPTSKAKRQRRYKRGQYDFSAAIRSRQHAPIIHTRRPRSASPPPAMTPRELLSAAAGRKPPGKSSLRAKATALLGQKSSDCGVTSGAYRLTSPRLSAPAVPDCDAGKVVVSGSDKPCISTGSDGRVRGLSNGSPAAKAKRLWRQK